MFELISEFEAFKVEEIESIFESISVTLLFKFSSTFEISAKLFTIFPSLVLTLELMVVIFLSLSSNFEPSEVIEASIEEIILLKRDFVLSKLD